MADTYPYWPPDRTQRPLNIPGIMLSRMLEDVRINRVPLRNDYSNSDVRVIYVPKVPQDSDNAAKVVGDRPVYGVGAPGSLYSLVEKAAANNGGEA